MERDFYLDLAARGLRWPIGTDLVLHDTATPKPSSSTAAVWAQSSPPPRAATKPRSPSR